MPRRRPGGERGSRCFGAAHLGSPGHASEDLMGLAQSGRSQLGVVIRTEVLGVVNKVAEHCTCAELQLS